MLLVHSVSGILTMWTLIQYKLYFVEPLAMLFMKYDAWSILWNTQILANIEWTGDDIVAAHITDWEAPK